METLFHTRERFYLLRRCSEQEAIPTSKVLFAGLLNLVRCRKVLLSGHNLCSCIDAIKNCDHVASFVTLRKSTWNNSAGRLSGVTLEWSHLDQDSGQARKFSDGGYLVLVDRRDNTTFAEVRRTLQHESCHVFVDWKESEMHGPEFRACMKRFRAQEP